MELRFSRSEQGKTARALRPLEPDGSLIIAHFAEEATNLKPWIPLAPARAELRALVRERLHVQQLALSEQVRELTAACSSRKAIAARISFLKEQLKDLNQRIKAIIKADPQLAQDAKLIASIPGIGAWTAAVLLSELPEINRKTSAREIAALFGLVPRNVQSGTSVRRKVNREDWWCGISSTCRRWSRSSSTQRSASGLTGCENAAKPASKSWAQ